MIRYIEKSMFFDSFKVLNSKYWFKVFIEVDAIQSTEKLEAEIFFDLNSTFDCIVNVKGVKNSNIINFKNIGYDFNIMFFNYIKHHKDFLCVV